MDEKREIMSQDILESIPETKKLMDHSRNANGDETGILKSLHNIDVVLENDIRFKDHLGYDVVANRNTIIGKVIWDNDMLGSTNHEIHPLLKHARYMTDFDLSEIKKIIQQDYYQNLTDIAEQIDNTCKHHCFDPIKDHLEDLGLQYDGGEYIKNLLPKYLGVKDDDYQKQVMLLIMMAFIERQYDPGVKFDGLLCILGPGGLGKTTYVQRLCFNDLTYYASITDDFKSKDTQQIIAGKRIIEIGEGASLRKSRTEETKDSLSARQETFRNPYGKYFQDYVRKSIFVMTSNETDLLTDPALSRRFLIVEGDIDRVKDVTYILKDKAQEDFDKAWGEAYVLWKANHESKDRMSLMEMMTAIAPEARKHADMHYEIDPIQGVIINYLDTKVSIYEKSFDEKLQRHTKPVPVVCVKEILDYLELGNSTKRYEKRDIAGILDNFCKDWKRLDAIHRCGIYGPQRCWEYTAKNEQLTAVTNNVKTSKKRLHPKRLKSKNVIIK